MEDEQISKDDIGWLDDPFADEGLMAAGMMIDMIKEYGLDKYISKEDALTIFDAADIWREALDHVLKSAARRQEVEELEELWTLN